MVAQTLHSISKAEKTLEHAASASMDANRTQVPAEQAAKEMRRMAEAVTFSAAKATDQWGKRALNKTKEITEEISL